jgi:hypothetical protein
VHRFDTRHVGSVCGGWDGGVMSWRATDLAEDDARQQAAGLNVTFNQYRQRDQADRREVSPADRGGVSHLVCCVAWRVAVRLKIIFTGPDSFPYRSGRTTGRIFRRRVRFHRPDLGPKPISTKMT